MVLDMRLVPNSYDDFVLWGGFVSRQAGRPRLIGAALPYLLSFTVASVFNAFTPAMPRLPGWLRGLLFIQVENAVLYPGVPLLQKIHPEVRSGRLPSLLTWQYFWVEIARHAAFGAVLGIVTERQRRP
jgi:hypothetical protein